MLVFTPRGDAVHVISLRRANHGKGCAMRGKPNPKLIDEDAPEATDEWFDEERAAKDVLPGLVGIDAAQQLLRPKRGRPRLANPKEHVNIRLDADVLRAFKSTGKGWQTRLNNALRDWLNTHASAR